MPSSMIATSNREVAIGRRMKSVEKPTWRVLAELLQATARSTRRAVALVCWLTAAASAALAVCCLLGLVQLSGRRRGRHLARGQCLDLAAWLQAELTFGDHAIAFLQALGNQHMAVAHFGPG